MSFACGRDLREVLTQVPDPRGRKGRRHSLSALLTAVVCGGVCGARGDLALVEWLHELPVDVWHWMGNTRRPPKQDCFRDLLVKLDPAALEAALRSWITDDLQLARDEETLSAFSLDGKTLCATLRAFAPAVHLLSAVDHQTGHVLAQCRVSDQTNEFKAALELLKTLCVLMNSNSVIRKFTRNRKEYPNRESALKLIDMAIHEASKKWTMPIPKWKEALNHFAILFEDRMPIVRRYRGCQMHREGDRTIRSDRAQNSRSESLNLIRNRKGRLPHIAVITAEPLPSRIASIALGTGDIDCVYHFARYELQATLQELGLENALELMAIMVNGGRLKDIADLPLDLAV